LDLNATAGISASSLFIMSREGKRSIHKNRRYNGVPLGMADKTAQFERRAFLAAALGAGLALTAGIGSAMAAKKTAKRRTITPSKTQVQSRSGPLKTARTALVPFDTAPFPYHGPMPGSNAPFMNVDEGGRKGHRTGSGRVYWEDQTYNDRRVCGVPSAGAAARERTVFSALERSRSTTVLIRTTWKPQSARQPIPATSNRSMSVPHCDDALQEEGTDRHGHKAEDDERMARRGREERLHV